MEIAASTAPPVLVIRVARGAFTTDGPVRYLGGAIVADGPSARWEWNGRTLSVDNDRHGVFPLFWHASNGMFAISPSVDALLQHGVPAVLDEAAMAVFLRAGHFIGDDTPFTTIRALPPAARLTWDGTAAFVSSGWSHPAPSAATRHELIDAFGDLVSKVVARQADSTLRPCVVPLSGGHDSRHIAFALQEHGVPFSCVTVEPYPPAAADDVAIARIVATALGVDHLVLKQRAHRVRAEREKNALTHLCADEHAQLLPLRDRFLRRDELLFDGLAGDVLSQSQRLDPALHRAFVDGRFDLVADRVLLDAASIEPALDGLLTRAAARRFPRSAAISRVVTEAAQHAGAPNPIASFFFFNRMRREVALAPYGLLAPCPVVTPFLDPAIVDLLMAAPFERVADRRLHTDALHRRYPQYADLPFDRKRRGAAAPATTRRQAAALSARVAAAPGRDRRSPRGARAHHQGDAERQPRAPVVSVEARPPDGRGGPRPRIDQIAGAGAGCRPGGVARRSLT